MGFGAGGERMREDAHSARRSSCEGSSFGLKLSFRNTWAAANLSSVVPNDSSRNKAASPSAAAILRTRTTGGDKRAFFSHDENRRKKMWKKY